MSMLVSQSPDRFPARMWRWGIGLGALAVIYIGAVIAFIIIY